MLLILPLTNALDFTENTTFSDKSINYHFIKGVSVDSFKIVSDGILLNSNQKFVFIVKGGELDVTFYGNDTIGLITSAPQDVVFKITKDSKKQYLKLNGDYYIDDISVSTNEIKPTIVLYKEGQTEFSDTVTNRIQRNEWYQKSFMSFEYDVKTNADGSVESKVFNLTYFLSIIVIIVGCFLIWWLFLR